MTEGERTLEQDARRSWRLAVSVSVVSEEEDPNQSRLSRSGASNWNRKNPREK